MSLRPAPANLARLLGTSHGVKTVVDIWLGDQLLAGALPLADGVLTEHADQRVPESLAFSVPVVDSGTGATYRPNASTAIRSNGQLARVTYVITRPSGVQVSCPLGWYLLTDWELAPDGDTIDCSAAGLLTVPDENKLRTMTSPPAGATLGTELVRLVEGDLPVDVQATGDRACPTSMAWQDDRLGALVDLATAWPAVLEVDTSGTLVVSNPPSATDPADLRLVEGGELNPVIGVGASGSRSDVFNVWVVRGEDSTAAARPPVSAVVLDDRPSSPTFVDTYGRRTAFFASPLINTTAQALATGRSLMLSSVAKVEAFPVVLVPDPRIKLNTIVDLTWRDGRHGLFRVVQNRLPLTAAGGQQTIYLAGL